MAGATQFRLRQLKDTQRVFAYLVASFLTIDATVRATSVTLVVPIGFEDREGNSVMAPNGRPYPIRPPAGVHGYRSQDLVSSELFEPLGPGPFEITAFAHKSFYFRNNVQLIAITHFHSNTVTPSFPPWLPFPARTVTMPRWISTCWTRKRKSSMTLNPVSLDYNSN